MSVSKPAAEELPLLHQEHFGLKSLLLNPLPDVQLQTVIGNTATSTQVLVLKQVRMYAPTNKH